MTKTLLLLLLPLSLYADWKDTWRLSAGALLTTNIIDCHSSYQKPELNPFLRSPSGHFSNKGIAIKMGIIAGLLIGQRVVTKKYPESTKLFAVTNFALAASTAWVANRNYNIPRQITSRENLTY